MLIIFSINLKNKKIIENCVACLCVFNKKIHFRFKKESFLSYILPVFIFIFLSPNLLYAAIPGNSANHASKNSKLKKPLLENSNIHPEKINTKSDPAEMDTYENKYKDEFLADDYEYTPRQKNKASIPTPKANTKQDLLVKLNSDFNSYLSFLNFLYQLQAIGEIRFEALPYSWILISKPTPKIENQILNHPAVEKFQDDKIITLKNDFQLEDPLRRAAFLRGFNKRPNSPPNDTNNSEPLIDEKSAQIAFENKPLLPLKKVRIGIIGPGVDYQNLNLASCLGLTNLQGQKSVGWDYIRNNPWPKEETKNLKDLVVNGGNAGLGTFLNQQICQTDSFQVNSASQTTDSEPVDLLNFKVLNQNGEGKTSDVIRSLSDAVNSGTSLLVLGFYQKINEVNVALDDAVSFVKEKSIFVIGDQLLRKLKISDENSLPSFGAYNSGPYSDINSEFDDPAMHFQVQGHDMQWDFNSFQKTRLANILTQQLIINPYLFSNNKIDMDVRLEAAKEKLLSTTKKNQNTQSTIK